MKNDISVWISIVCLIVAITITTADCYRDCGYLEEVATEQNTEAIETFKASHEVKLMGGKYETQREAETEIIEGPKYYLLGEFKLTAYCPCEKCCGKWAAFRDEGVITASGAYAKANHTVAVDPRVIPYGTKLLINGIEYVAEDCGGSIKGNRIDIYFESHSEAWNFGVQYADVFIKNEIDK